MFHFLKFLLETPNDGGGPAAVAPEPIPTPPPGDAPWASDLAGLVPDEAARGAVDGYLREKWQPRMTQLEQQYAETETARSLYGDFQSDPVQTFLDVATEIFEDQPDILEQIAGAFAQPDAQAATTDAPAPTSALTPEQEQMLSEWQHERDTREQAEAYSNEIESLKAAHPEDRLIDHARLAPFVITANGDFAQAYAGFRAFIDDFTAATGATDAQAASALAGITAPAPPAVLGTTAASGTGSPPPTQTKYASLDAALDDAMVDLRASREAPPTVVGSV